MKINRHGSIFYGFFISPTWAVKDHESRRYKTHVRIRDPDHVGESKRRLLVKEKDTQPNLRPKTKEKEQEI